MGKKFEVEEGELTTTGRGWGETRDWHHTDQRICKAGFKIHSRPRRGAVVWIDLRGDLWTQAEVERYLRRNHLG